MLAHKAYTCTDMVDAYSCACVPGYTDANCATDISECNPDPCENGGTCTDMVNAYVHVFQATLNICS